MIEFSPIADTQVISITSDKAAGLMVKLRSTAEPPIICPHCGAERVRNGTRKVIFRDAPQHGQPIAIEWKRQNFLCPRCSRSSHDAHPAFDKRHAVTTRFADWVSFEGTNVTFSSLSKLSGVNEKVIRQIFGAAKEAGSASAQTEILGIELIKVAGSLYPALIDVHNRALLDVLSSEGALLNYLALAEQFSAEILSAAIVVRDIELSDGLEKWFSPIAQHVISRSSLHRSVVMVMEAAVKPLFKTLLSEENPSTGPDLALFRKRQPELGRTSQKRLLRWKDLCPPIYQIYDLKERFLNLWAFDNNPPENDWNSWKLEASALVLHLGALVRRIDANRKAIDAYPLHRVLCYSYPGTLAKTEDIDKAATHSFSASRAILLKSQGKKADAKS